jgi:cytochrome P450
MLLAGTDTSSVTLFYAALALADNTSICGDLACQQLCSAYQKKTHGANNKCMVLFGDGLTHPINACQENLDRFVYEVMRTKPVGPVIIRRAVANDTNLPITVTSKTGVRSIAAGTGIIMNLERMHHKEDIFPFPKVFNPDRFCETNASRYFVPFGYVPHFVLVQFIVDFVFILI